MLTHRTLLHLRSEKKLRSLLFEKSLFPQNRALWTRNLRDQLSKNKKMYCPVDGETDPGLFTKKCIVQLTGGQIQGCILWPAFSRYLVGAVEYPSTMCSIIRSELEVAWTSHEIAPWFDPHFLRKTLQISMLSSSINDHPELLGLCLEPDEENVLLVRVTFPNLQVFSQ